MKIPFNDEKIAKYLSGESNDFETKDIKEWIESDPENKEWIEEFSKVWNTEYKNESIHKEYLKPDWNDLEENYLQNKKNPVSILLYSAAAVILISFSLFSYFKNEELIIFQTSETIKEITLSDNSKITLNYNSKVIYSEEFGTKNRDIFLEGEAFFTVTANKDLPFIIHTDQAITEVVGTEFNLKSRGEKTQLIVTEGIVTFESKAVENASVTVLAGQEGVILGRTKPIVTKSTSESSIRLSWMKKQLIFKDAKFADIIIELNAIFNSSIQFTDDIEDLKVTAVIKYDKSLKDVLENLSESLDLKLVFDSKNISFSKK